MIVRLGRVQPEVERRAWSMVGHRRPELAVLVAWAAWCRRRDAELIRQVRLETAPFRSEVEYVEYLEWPYEEVRRWAGFDPDDDQVSDE